jgi:hypothetical protein
LKKEERKKEKKGAGCRGWLMERIFWNLSKPIEEE